MKPKKTYNILKIINIFWALPFCQGKNVRLFAPNFLLRKKISASILNAFFILIINSFVFPQENINIETAINLAKKNNIVLNIEKLKVEYQQKRVNTYNNIPKTEISTEIGQINSNAFDNKFSVNQSFNFPTVYKRQKEVYNQHVKYSQISSHFKELEIIKNIKEIFLEYSFILEKEKLLLQSDSIYSKFLEKSKLRFLKGQNNLIEQKMSENLRNSVSLQLNLINQEKENTLIKLNYLINNNPENYKKYIPESDFFNGFKLDLINNKNLENHFNIQLLKQQESILKSEIRLEKAKLLPDFFIGISSSTIKGEDLQNDMKRFNVFMAGISLSIFNKSQKNNIKLLDFQNQIIQKKILNSKNNLNKELILLENTYKSIEKNIDLFYNQNLKNSEIITKSIDLQLINGEINYLDWVQITNQTVQTKNEYLDLYYNLNKTAIELEFIQKNN